MSAEKERFINLYTQFYTEITNPEHPRILSKHQVIQKIGNGEKMVLYGLKRNAKWALLIFSCIFASLGVGSIIVMEIFIGFDYLFAPNTDPSTIFFATFFCFLLLLIFGVAIWLFIKSLSYFIWSKSYLVLGSEGFLHHYRRDEFYFWNSITEIKVKFLGGRIGGYSLYGMPRKLKFLVENKQVTKSIDLEPIRNSDFKVEGIAKMEKKVSGLYFFVEIFRKYWETSKK